jgi:hypothetical protein
MHLEMLSQIGERTSLYFLLHKITEAVVVILPISSTSLPRLVELVLSTMAAIRALAGSSAAKMANGAGLPRTMAPVLG